MTCYNVVNEIKFNGERSVSMDAIRTANREADEITLRYQSPQKILLSKSLPKTS
jgi:hypothetical protein